MPNGPIRLGYEAVTPKPIKPPRYWVTYFLYSLGKVILALVLVWLVFNLIVLALIGWRD